MPAGDPVACATAPQIAPKWIAEDGKSFWLVWTEVLPPGGPLDEAVYRARNQDEFMRARWQWRQANPHWAFNTQRVDLVTWVNPSNGS